MSPAHNVPPTTWGQSGCTIRTDSNGVVYVFYEQFQSPFRFLPPRGSHMLVKSFDGGRSWTGPQVMQRVTDPCFFVDPVIARCVMDGVAGARSDLAAAPNVDIANGAPTGMDATDEIVLAWVDGRGKLNNEDVMVSWSTGLGSFALAPATLHGGGRRRIREHRHLRRVVRGPPHSRAVTAPGIACGPASLAGPHAWGHGFTEPRHPVAGRRHSALGG